MNVDEKKKLSRKLSQIVSDSSLSESSISEKDQASDNKRIRMDDSNQGGETNDSEIDQLTAESKRLAPIRFFIDKTMVMKYQQVGALANEISKCFPKASLNIKFTYTRDHKVFIVTDDNKTHELLSNMDNWPEKAFDK